MDLFIENFNYLTPTHPNITPPFFHENDTAANKIRALLRQHRRAKSLKSRTEILFCTFYIGQTLETLTESAAERSRCLELISSYMKEVAICTYYLFEFLGLEQIARTRS